jgi:hypothetical protein
LYGGYNVPNTVSVLTADRVNRVAVMTTKKLQVGKLKMIDTTDWI